jgi:hypothetical protein
LAHWLKQEILMKNILTIGLTLMAGYAGLGKLPAQQQPAAQAAMQEPAAFAKAVASIMKTVAGAPFSAVEEITMTQTLADGNRIVRTMRRKVYRDSQGREGAEQEATMATMMVLGERVSVPSIIITDPISGVTYNLDPAKKTAWKRAGVQISLALVGNMAGVVRSAFPGVVPAKEQLAPTMVEGLPVEGTRSTTTVPAGQVGNERDILVVDEVWYSPDLQMNLMTKHSDPRGGETVYKLTTISRSEPDPALFQVPAGYTITEGRPPETLFIFPPPTTQPPAK